ncbi:heterokaryon incompatibility protein-domain-containing protein, partial [Diaporthe sp. PMI_573]
NFDLHRRWLQHCRDHHNDSCNNAPDASRVPNLKLIDCETRKVHDFQHGDVYSALSYRWGPNEKACENQDKLPQCLPPTIEDALLVTRELDIRYIWIDRYCIPQHGNAEVKGQQIKNMHRIYRGAEVTIVAAAGESPEYGLPGVSRKMSIPPRLKIGNQKFACIPPDPQLLIESSTWSSRGWTYQEGLLSRRRLVFTDQQSYFQC